MSLTTYVPATEPSSGACLTDWLTGCAHPLSSAMTVTVPASTTWHACPQPAGALLPMRGFLPGDISSAAIAAVRSAACRQRDAQRSRPATRVLRTCCLLTCRPAPA